MSLLSLVQDACRDLSIAVPASVFANTDPDIQKLQGFAKRAGEEFRERWTWRNLITGGTVAGDGRNTLFALPDSFGALAPTTVLVSHADTLPLIGPVNPEALLLMKARQQTPSRKVFRLVGGTLEIYPAPAAGEVIAFEYLSKGWIRRAADGAAQTTWSADADVSLIPEHLIALSAIWRWKRSNGLDYAEEFRSCESAFERLSAQETLDRTIAMSNAIPVCDDTSWPGTIAAP